MTKQLSAKTNGVVLHPTDVPSSEVHPVGERVARSMADKLRILQEYDAAPAGSGARGTVLRREGISTSHISKWRKQLQRGRLAEGTMARPGPKPAPAALREEVARLRKEHARLQTRLERAEAIIDVQKKVAHLLGTTLPSPPADEL